MNEIEHKLSTHSFEDKNLRKQQHILRNTKKKRIKDKAFNKLLVAYTNKYPVASFDNVVLIQKELYDELEKIKNAKDKIESLEGISNN